MEGFPLRVVSLPGRGLSVLASRPLRAGELVLCESAALLSFEPSLPPLCLLCSSPSPSSQCPLCSSPFCCLCLASSRDEHAWQCPLLAAHARLAPALAEEERAFALSLALFCASPLPPPLSLPPPPSPQEKRREGVGKLRR